MIDRFRTWVDERERQWRRSFGRDLSTVAGRRAALLHYHLFDHAFLRLFWTNLAEIAPGVFRSNQPDHARLRRYRDMGIRTIINLRGASDQASYQFERDSCEALGLTLVSTRIWARKPAPRENLLAMIEAMRHAEGPFLFHCKSGADRAGFAAATYLMVFRNVPVAEAKAQLSWRYWHLKSTATGVQDYILDIYEARLARGAIGFEDWIAREYDDKAIRAAFAAGRPAAELA